MMVDLESVVDVDAKELGIAELVYYPVLADLLEETGGDIDELKEEIRRNIHELIPKHITKEDILASINYNIHLEYGIGTDDDIDVSVRLVNYYRTSTELVCPDWKELFVRE